ncbi:MAG: hypothetical protein IKR18_11670 [Bacteroidaceae bacterium]|nr:hypothetical protein [Bacteroidaceae bacterium]
MKQYGKLWGMLTRLGYSGQEATEMKERMVGEYTGGRTTSLKAMTETEYGCMVKTLESMTGKDAERETLKKKRRLCLMAMEKLGVCTLEWSVIDRFCMRPQIAGKKFSKLSIDELDRVTRQCYKIKNNGRGEGDNRAVETPGAGA